MALVTRQRSTVTPRFNSLCSLGRGVEILVWLRRNQDGRALAAVYPTKHDMPVLLRTYQWPRSFYLPLAENSKPVSVSISSQTGEIFVLVDCSIQVFGRDGRLMRLWGGKGSVPGMFVSPWAVAVSSINRMIHVCVADAGKASVEVLSDTGAWKHSLIPSAPSAAFQGLIGVAIHDDKVFCIDQLTGLVHCFAVDAGTYLQCWGNAVDPITQRPFLDHPISLAVSANGNVFVCNASSGDVLEMVVFNRDGIFVRRWGGGRGTAQGQFFDVQCVAVSPLSDEVFVSYAGYDWSDGDDSDTDPAQFVDPARRRVDRVQVFLADGTFVRCLHLGSATDTSWPIYVKKTRVRVPAKCKQKKQPVATFVPTGIAVTSTGEVIVCDTAYNRVLVEVVGS